MAIMRIKRIASAALVATLCAMPLAAIAQTTVKAPSNKYKVEDDVRLGRQAANEVEQQFPVLNDHDATNYVSRVGERLVARIPSQFRQPRFDYRFKIVNARDLNAFALPGGPMYINRGMIEAARNEGEMAGVMAHEISHVALRHATAQATKQSSAKSVLGQLGLILGGAILGGQTGAAVGGLIAQGWMTKYSREYETQADTLGAQIMADAGYDPRDLANVFQTIARQGGSGAPEWLSSHPDPGNRYNRINQMAANMRVSPNPIKMTADFERTQARFRSMPPARSMAEIERDYKAGRTETSPSSTGQYSNNVPMPSSSMRRYSTTGLTINVPSNWREFASSDTVTFVPEGAYGDQGITHGSMIGTYRGTGNLAGDSEGYVRGVLEANRYLRQDTGFARANVGGRSGYVTSLSGRSPVTGRTELVFIYTFQLRNGNLFYLVNVVPENERYSYDRTFRNMVNSVRVSD